MSSSRLYGSTANSSAPKKKPPDNVTHLYIPYLYHSSLQSRSTPPGTTALHHAAMLDSAEATEILLSNGAWPMYKCKSSKSTPLHIVASTGSTETLMILLEAMLSYNIDTRDQVGFMLFQFENNKRNCTEMTLRFSSLRSIVRLFIEQLTEVIANAYES